MGGVASDRSGDLVLLTEEAVLGALGVALGLTFLVLGVSLDSTLLTGGLPALDTGDAADGFLDLAQGVFNGSSGLATYVVRSWTVEREQEGERTLDQRTCL